MTNEKLLLVPRKDQTMNQMFIICCVISATIAIALFKKVGFWWALVIAFVLPLCLFVIAVILLIAGGDM